LWKDTEIIHYSFKLFSLTVLLFVYPVSHMIMTCCLEQDWDESKLGLSTQHRVGLISKGAALMGPKDWFKVGKCHPRSANKTFPGIFRSGD
jgi:hypothetical protein